MTQNAATSREPLWLRIEQKIRELGDDDLSESKLEATTQRLASEFDGTGMNFSRRADRMLLLRAALRTRGEVGRSFLQDFDEAISALTLDDVADSGAATRKLVENVGQTWPKLKLAERRPDVKAIVEGTRLKLLVARARELGGESGVRYLIEAKLAPKVITRELDITEDEFARVNAAVAAERAERSRVAGLLKEVADKPDTERIKHLINKEVSDQLILEMASVDQVALDGVKQAMEKELAEQRRQAEEEAARKKAEAEGPPLEDIPDDEMLDYIESIREILEFSDVEDEIRAMCEQSNIPKCLVDITVSTPDKLDELEAKAGG
jgi:hypothetical protein